MRRLTLLLLCALAALPLAGQTTLNGAGATFPYPMYSKWFSEYHKLHGDVQVNYQSIGSGGGIRQVTEGTVDFGASDMPMTEAQLKEAQEKRKTRILNIPTVLGADVPAYNIPGVTGEVKFTPDALAGIFLGKITKWNDGAITGANPGMNLPDKPIIVVHRSDGSGTSFIWTDYLSKISSEWESKVGRNTSVQWPVGLGGKGNEGVAGSIRQLPGSIGYVELIYAGKLRESFTGECHRRGRICSEDASGFSGFYHERARQGRVSDFQFHLAADSGTIKRCGERQNAGRFSELDGHRRSEVDSRAKLFASTEQCCPEGGGSH
jgi:phosphate transport system substrate-binding protein